MGTTYSLYPLDLPGHFIHELPPSGFKPLEASDDELARYGVLHRPDPRVSPEAARLWRHVMGRVKTFIRPKLTVNPKRLHLPARNVQTKKTTKTDFAGTAGSENWSGVVMTDAPPYSAVWGTWTIPDVQTPPGQNKSDGFSCSCWVGLGGASAADQNLFQAGTEQDTQDGKPNYYAWLEWLTATTPAPEKLIANFPIQAGQTVVFAVGHYGDASGRGYVTAANLETGIAIPLTIVAKPDNTIVSPSTVSAEWIVERPAISVDPLILTELADYGEVNMTLAGASSNANARKTFNIAAASDTSATIFTMLADDGATPLSEEIDTAALHFTFQQTAAGK
jgi:hypothetical protein